jgi:hypothetical protein
LEKIGQPAIPALIAGLNRFPRARDAASGTRSIAVLPLENVSADRDQEYFAEGITDALINDLAEIQGVRVISRTSSMSIKRGTRRLPEIAKSLKKPLWVQCPSEAARLIVAGGCAARPPNGAEATRELRMLAFAGAGGRRPAERSVR